VNEPRLNQGPTDEQRRRIRRNAVVLGLLALGIYVAFIASGVLGLRG
jgi:hypothetical protein